MAWHAFFKDILSNILQEGDVSVTVEKEVGSLPLRIDIVIKKKGPSKNKTTYLKTFISMLKSWNIIELKMAKETLTYPKILKTIGYFGLFGSQEKFQPEDTKETLIWILISQKPIKLFKQFEEIGQEIISCGFEGCYEINLFIPIRIIVFNELPIKEEFYPFLLFSRGNRLKQFFHDILAKNNKVFINWCYFLYREELIQMAKALNKPLDSITRSVRETVIELGIANVIDAVGIEKVIDAVGIEKVIDAVGIEKVIDAVGIEKILESIPLEKLKTFIEKKEEQSKK